MHMTSQLLGSPHGNMRCRHRPGQQPARGHGIVSAAAQCHSPPASSLASISTSAHRAASHALRPPRWGPAGLGRAQSA